MASATRAARSAWRREVSEARQIVRWWCVVVVGAARIVAQGGRDTKTWRGSTALTYSKPFTPTQLSSGGERAILL